MAENTKSVLMSIQPRWCELIASGKKTVEVRKTRPKLEPTFKVYIYCTKDNTFAEKTLRGFDNNGKAVYYKANKGKVIGEFVCDEILDCRDVNMDDTCLTVEEWLKYTKGHEGVVYGWHISDLVIYDNPKELSEFHVPGYNDMKDMDFIFGSDEKYWKIKRPPQSWCYVEEG